MPPISGNHEEALLRAQLADLVRFRHILDAQRAVLRLDDSRMLTAFAREASEIADAVLARDAVLIALRSAAQREPEADPKAALPALEDDVHRARLQASAESLALARTMEQAAQGIARELELVGQQLDQVLGTRLRRDVPGQPILVDRTG